MKIGFLFIWLAFASQINLSAQNYFSKVYESDTASIVFYSIVEKDSIYYVIGSSLSQVFPHKSYLMIYRVNKNGDIFSQMILDESIGRMSANKGGRGLIKISDDEFIFIYSKEESFVSNTSNVAVIRFNLDGQVSWVNNYGNNPDDPETLWSISPLGENYVLTGWNGEGGIPESYIWYLMINGEGEVLWEQQHYYNDTYTLGIDGYVTRDKEILLGGSTGASLDETEVYYAKADSMGNIIWEHTYGSENLIDGRCMLRDFTKDEYLLSGAHNGYQWTIKRINKLSGSIISSNEIEIGIQYAGQFINNQDYHIFGNIPFRVQYRTFENYNNGIKLIYLSNSLELIYEKELTIDSLYSNYTNDFRKTPNDNGYMACGWIDTYPNYSKGWIMKMDSLGNTCNGFPNCDTTILIPNTNTVIETIATHHPLILSPNPVTNELHYRVDCNDCGIAEKVLIEIYDLTGNLIACDSSPVMMGDNTMDTSAWPSGMYIIALFINGQLIHNQRLIKHDE